MEILEVDGTTFELVADSVVMQNDWIVQVSTEHSAYFNSIKGKVKLFRLEVEGNHSLEGYVLSTETHKHNLGKPQLQIQIRRSGY